jgi:hypothetical protein
VLGSGIVGKPVKVESLEVNEADDGLVVYDAARDVVHHLNVSAALIFDLCDGARSADDIAAVLAEVHGLPTPPVAETRSSLAELTERGLIRYSG